MTVIGSLVLLLTTAFVINAAVGLLIGVRMATRVGSRLDKVVAYFAAISYAVPAWWLGILFIVLFAFQLGWLPSGGMFSTPPPQSTWPRLLDLGKHALLPIITLVTVSVGPSIYVVRTMTVTVAPLTMSTGGPPLARAVSSATLRPT